MAGGSIYHCRKCGSGDIYPSYCRVCLRYRTQPYRETPDTSGGRGQLRESHLRSAAKAGLSGGRSIDNVSNVEEEISTVWGTRVHRDHDPRGDRGDRTGAGWSTSYYQLPDGAVELQDLIEHKGMSFAVGNIFKAAYRLGGKVGVDEVYDLNKIIWFAERELRRVTDERSD